MRKLLRELAKALEENKRAGEALMAEYQALQAKCEEQRKALELTLAALEKHNHWQNEIIGEVKFPDSDITIDLSAEYSDSDLCEQTYAAIKAARTALADQEKA